MTAAPVRVLLIEPHDDSRELYLLGLASMGWDVVAVPDAASAGQAFLRRDPTVVVTQTWLPGGGEAAFLKHVSGAGVPVIALTTLPAYQHDPSDSAGLSLLLMKPCDPDELAAAIQRVLGAGV